MAERRMFAKAVVLSDAFLDLPVRSRCLYFVLGMVADDDGFINSHKSVLRQCGATATDLKRLIEGQFLLEFPSGVVVIRHWRVHNLIRKDRYRETVHVAEKAQLMLDENDLYRMSPATKCQPDDNQMATQDRIGQDRVGQDRTDQKKTSQSNKGKERRNEERRGSDAGCLPKSKQIEQWKSALLNWEQKEQTKGETDVKV